AKGELIMENAVFFSKGGKSGIPWDSLEPTKGLLFARLHLPEGDKKRMPPTGKPQLDTEELAIIVAWLNKGASFNLQVSELKETDSLYQIAKVRLKGNDNNYPFEAADPELVRNLNNENRVI